MEVLWSNRVCRHSPGRGNHACASCHTIIQTVMYVLQVYRNTVQPLVATLFRGGKATCFAYGQVCCLALGQVYC